MWLNKKDKNKRNFQSFVNFAKEKNNETFLLNFDFLFATIHINFFVTSIMVKHFEANSVYTSKIEKRNMLIVKIHSRDEVFT